MIQRAQKCIDLQESHLLHLA